MAGTAITLVGQLGWLLRRSRPGQSVVEFAIVLPVLLFIALGAVDVGRVFFDYIGLRAAAMDGALYGARFPDETADIKQRVADHFAPNPLPAGTGITVAADPICIGTASLGKTGFVSVTVTRQFKPVSLSALQFLANGMNWTFTISPTAKARCMT